MKHIKELMG